MSLAFCILAHKSPDQVRLLLGSIWESGNTYVLHYDRRAPQAEHAKIAALKNSFPGLHVLPAREVNWGRFSVVGIQLDAINVALKAPGNWSHFFTLSGQDLPLTRIRGIDAELADFADRSFVSWFDPAVTGIWKNLEDRLSLRYLDIGWIDALIRLPGIGRRIRSCLGWKGRMPHWTGVRRGSPTFFRYYGGANHVILARNAAHHLGSDANARRIIDWLTPSGIPDESLFQSVLLNSPLAETVVNDDRRAIFWDPGAASPRTLTIADLPKLREAKAQGKLFARKFDPAVDEAVIEEVERWGKTEG